MTYLTMIISFIIVKITIIHMFEVVLSILINKFILKS